MLNVFFVLSFVQYVNSKILFFSAIPSNCCCGHAEVVKLSVNGMLSDFSLSTK